MNEITHKRQNTRQWMAAGIASLTVFASAAAAAIPAFARQDGGGTKPAAPGAASPQTGTTDQAYKISPEDVLEVFVVNRGELSKVVPVLPNGHINYPYIGEIDVTGMTLGDLQKKITTAISKYYVKPEVTVSLRDRQIRYINVAGQGVKTSGKLPMKDKWHIFDALIAAGGLSVERPEWVKARLIRDGQVSDIDMYKLYSDADSDENRALKPDDTILVDLLDPSQIQAQVTGEVNKVGPVTVPRDGSIVAVLNAAGGTTERAALSKVVIVRDGQNIPVDLRRLEKDGSTPEGIRVKPGDTLVIPENKNYYNVAGAVSAGGQMVYPDDKTITVMDAWVRAGGQPVGADMKNAKILRPSTDGKETEVINIRLDEIVKGDLSRNVALQPNDMLYVPASNRRKFNVQDIFSFIPTVGWIYSLTR